MTELNYCLLRYSDNHESTLGLFYLRLPDGLMLQGYTLEDEHRAVKVAGETRIPAGRYELSIRQELTPATAKYRKLYPWFQYHVEILNVPGFTNVYIHVGNKDTDTDGCVLLGDTANNNQISKGFTGESVHAYRRFYAAVTQHLRAGGQAFLTVVDEDALAQVAA